MSTDNEAKTVSEIQEVTLPKIYIFVNGDAGHLGIIGVSVAEDGEGLTSHLSSNYGWFRHDMGLASEWKHEVYKEKYPAGYDLVELQAGDPKIADLVEKNIAREPEPEAVSND